MILAPLLLLSTPNMPESEPTDVPEGFDLIRRGGPYFRALGAVYRRVRDDGGWVVALRLDEAHLNMQGFAHGGMLATLADGALGINIALARGTREAQVTVTLNMDYLAAARRGDWLEAHVVVTRMGRTLAFANCDLRVGARHVLRANAVFAFVDRPPLPIQPDDGPVADG